MMTDMKAANCEAIRSLHVGSPIAVEILYFQRATISEGFRLRLKA